MNNSIYLRFNDINARLSFNYNRYIQSTIYQCKVYSSKKYSTKIRKPKKPPIPDLNEFQKEVIFGCMLGNLMAERLDSHQNTRLRFIVNNLEKAYINHLYSIFSVYVKTPPKDVIVSIFKLKKGITKEIMFSTLKYEYFNWIEETFYLYIEERDRKLKIVPENARDKLTPVSLAYLIMDSDAYSGINGGISLNTEKFSDKDVLYLMNILETKFNLSCSLINYPYMTNKEEIRHRININKSSLPDLINLVKPYMIPSMLYKLGIST